VVAQLLELKGQEVIVANARKLKLISENNQKSDRVDALLLSELGCTNVAWLHGGVGTQRCVAPGFEAGVLFVPEKPRDLSS